MSQSTAQRGYGGAPPRNSSQETSGGNSETLEQKKERLLHQSGLPGVIVSNKQLRDYGKEVLNHLAARKDCLFVRPEGLVCIETIEERVCVETVEEKAENPEQEEAVIITRPVVRWVDERKLRGILADSMNFVKEDETGRPYNATPPDVLVSYIHSRGSWPFPSLEGVTEVPVLRPNGTILNTPGYDKPTGLYYRPAGNLKIPEIPESPTPEQIQGSIDLLCESIEGFPFVDDASRANALACLFTPVIRPALSGNVPLALLDAPKQGTGKTKIAHLTSIIATGRLAPVETVPGNDDEWRKKITSNLKDAKPIVVIDNVIGTLASQHLDAALTTPVWSDRFLGRTEQVTYKQSITWIATGNNIKVGGDLGRRCYWVRIDAQTAKPWERKDFAHTDLEGWALENRGRLIAAVLTLARAWYAAGKPKPEKAIPTFGSFEKWAEIVGGILACASVPEFLGNKDELQENAVEDGSSQWGSFLHTLHEVLGGREITSSLIFDALEGKPSLCDGPATTRLREDLPEDLGDYTEKGFKKRLGKALKKYTETRFDDTSLHLKHVREDSRNKTGVWKLTTESSTGARISRISRISEQSFPTTGSEAPHVPQDHPTSEEGKGKFPIGIKINPQYPQYPQDLPSSIVAGRGGEAGPEEDDYDPFLPDNEVA